MGSTSVALLSDFSAALLSNALVTLSSVWWLQKPADDKAVKGKKGGAKGKKEEKEAVPTENGETKAEGVR